MPQQLRRYLCFLAVNSILLTVSSVITFGMHCGSAWLESWVWNHLLWEGFCGFSWFLQMSNGMVLSVGHYCLFPHLLWLHHMIIPQRGNYVKNSLLGYEQNATCWLAWFLYLLFWPFWQRKYIPLKHQWASTRLHGVTS
jgi:hypothetical protein